MSRADALRMVAEHVPYLTVSTVTNDEPWVVCADLLDNPTALTDLVRSTKPGFGTDDDGVAASLFAESYAFRVAGVPLAAFALDLPVPDLAPRAIVIKVDKPRPSAVAYLGTGQGVVAAATLAALLVDEHLGPFAESLHAAFRVGEPLLRSDVADALALTFRAVESSVDAADRPRVRERAHAFFDSAGAALAATGNFTTVAHAGREGWYWDRKSCCLWFRTPGSELCDNCSLVPAVELLERRRRALEQP